MKTKLLTLLLILALPGLSPAGYAQDMRTVIQKSREVYKATSYKTVVKYQYFLKPADTKPSETSVRTFIKKGASTYSKLNNLEIISNTYYKVILDHSSHNLFLEDKRRVAGDDFVPDAEVQTDFMDLDTALKMCSSKSYRKEGAMHICTFLFEDEEFDKIEFFLDAGYVLKKTLIHLNVDPYGKPAKTRLEIHTVSFEKNPVLPADQFSEKKYVVIKNTTVTPVGAFKDYRVMSNLEEE